MSLAAQVISRTSARILGVEPYEHVRIPEGGNRIANIDYVFTTDGGSPRWDNLAIFVCDLSGQKRDLHSWQNRVQKLPVDGAILVADRASHFVRRDQEIGAAAIASTPEQIQIALESYCEQSFTPRRLAALRSGQLSFADTANKLVPGTLEFVSRHRKHLDDALSSAVKDALGAYREFEGGKLAPGVTEDDVLDAALGYLAARILEDKGVLMPQAPAMINSPAVLLERVVHDGRNGFFRRALEAARKLAKLPVVTMELVEHLGPKNTFSLVDHVDVGRYYERFLHQLRLQSPDLSVPWADLNQHYTPMALTTRMLERLPIERLPPQDRYVFDPAAGSGSLLIAATLRLSSINDASSDPLYLQTHVIGNDKDTRAKDIAFVRYCLLQESRRGTKPLPEPRYTSEDYLSFRRETLPCKPRVLLANPPFGMRDGQQEAARFVVHALDWLDDGAQVGLILPETFLTQKTDDVHSARRKLRNRVNVLEVWQLPEGVVGLSARQRVCVVLGVVGSTARSYPVARAVIAEGSKTAVKSSGFLGPAWISQLAKDAFDWSSVVAPAVIPRNEGIPLGALYHVCLGPTPESGVEPLAKKLSENAKPFWRVSWQMFDLIWANPRRSPRRKDGLGNRYWRDKWRRSAETNQELLDGHKIMLVSSNKNSKRPIRVCFDTTGFWPDHKTLCVAARTDPVATVPAGWERLNSDEKLLWLLGILCSDLSIDLILGGRDSRDTSKAALLEFPLPRQVDTKIVELMAKVVEQERKLKRASMVHQSPLSRRRSVLEELVDRSYGSPRRLHLSRVGLDPQAQTADEERKLDTVVVTGQVVRFRPASGSGRVQLHLSGLLDERLERWVTLPQELPGWALDGTPFTARMPRDIKWFRHLNNRPWALHDFRHEPTPYISIDELLRELDHV